MAGTSQPFQIKIGSVKRLELFVDCPGRNDFAQAAWMAPRLTNERASAKGSKDSTLQVLHAKYGANDRWMDVTDKLNSMVHDKSLTFTVEFWYTMGDLTPGVPKSLKLSYRLNGIQIDKEFPPLAMVAVGTGPPRPENAPRGLVITQALWGVADRWADVTQLVQQRVQDNRLKGVSSAAWMGYSGDPLPDVLKTLAIRYYIGSREHHVEIREKEPISLGLGAK